MKRNSLYCRCHRNRLRCSIILLISELNFKCCFQVDLIDLQWQFVFTMCSHFVADRAMHGTNKKFFSKYYYPQTILSSTLLLLLLMFFFVWILLLIFSSRAQFIHAFSDYYVFRIWLFGHFIVISALV